MDSQSCKRLTWHPSLPGPFESGHSIFKKIIALNHITRQELTPLIQRNGTWSTRDMDVNFVHSHWIDFDRLSSLLNVSSVRLKQGFLDQLGFQPLASRNQNVVRRLRYCLECAKFGYHCVFFNLAIIAECPWHRRPLISAANGCMMCSPYYREALGTPSDFVCAKCGAGTKEMSLMSQCLGRFDANQEATIHGYCIELAQWRRSVSKESEECLALLKDLDTTGESKPGFLEDVSGPLGYATVVADVDLFWKFVAPITPVRHVRLRDVQTTDVRPPNRIRDIEGKEYRSIGRQIYKRYIQPHRKCLARLRKLSREESLSLNGQAVCPTALAYLVWRMAVEGIGNVEGVRVPRTSNYALRLTGPHSQSSSDCCIRWTYLLFFALLHQLRTDCGKTKLQVTFGRYCDWGQRFLWNAAMKEGTQPNNYWHDVLYPLPMDSEANPCRVKDNVAESLMNGYALDALYNFAWVGSEGTRDAMFRILPDADKQNGIYFHINV